MEVLALARKNSMMFLALRIIPFVNRVIILAIIVPTQVNLPVLLAINKPKIIEQYHKFQVSVFAKTVGMMMDRVYFAHNVI